MPGGKPVYREAVGPADEIKWVVGKEEHIEDLDRFLATVPLKPSVQICLQPVSRNERATELCYQACLERGWRLSLQLHKYIKKA
jgi:7-carboxy-7-deazaguanine synthase